MLGKIVAVLMTFVVIVGGALGVGWIKNIIILFNYSGDVTGQFLLRLIGVVVVPLGGVMGWM